MHRSLLFRYLFIYLDKRLGLRLHAQLQPDLSFLSHFTFLFPTFRFMVYNLYSIKNVSTMQ